jgi:uncharacterized protein YdeI (YjbR/CyaY-like superfamily)
MTRRNSLEPRPVLFRDRQAWRRWLEKNHDRVGELWLAYFKKHTGKRSVTYPDALDEALCFGWIDGIVRSIDDERYMQRWTPRKNPKGWSAANLAHVRRLVAQGRMTPAGLAVLGVPLDVRNEDGAVRAKPPGRRGGTATGTGHGPVPEFITRALARNRAAAAFFARLAPSHRRRYVAWILGAKRDETRARRLAEAVRLLAGGLKELMK